MSVIRYVDFLNFIWLYKSIQTFESNLPLYAFFCAIRCYSLDKNNEDIFIEMRMHRVEYKI